MRAPVKIEAFCAWGDGPDVGINYFNRNDALIPIDLTAPEARKLAAELIAAADASDALDRDLEAYEADAKKAPASSEVEPVCGLCSKPYVKCFCIPL